jgi:uncharacterized protein (UPF0303 family)
MDQISTLLQTVLHQERTLQFTRFDNEMALALGLRLVQAAARGGHAVTANISRNGQVLFHHAMVGTTANHAEWIRRKNNVVNRFGHSSYYIGLEARQRGHDFDRNPTLDVKDFAACGGAFPLTIREVGQVGTITVSGLSQEQDHALVVDAVAEFLELPARLAAC